MNPTRAKGVTARTTRGEAPAEGEIGRCTCVHDTLLLEPGLGRDPVLITEQSPDPTLGGLPNTMTGCSWTEGGPSSAIYMFHLTSTAPLVCPGALGGPVAVPAGMPIETGTAHIEWSSGRTTYGRLEITTTEVETQLGVVLTFTSGFGCRAGYRTQALFTIAYTVNQRTFDCTTPGNPDPIRHLKNSNVGDMVIRRLRIGSYGA